MPKYTSVKLSLKRVLISNGGLIASTATLGIYSMLKNPKCQAL